MAVKKFPTPEEFCLEIPLYSPYPVEEETLEAIIALFRYEGHLDTYCTECKSASVFNCNTDDYGSRIVMDNWMDRPYRTINAVCSRNRDHVAIYKFRCAADSGIQKVGQFPSSADSNIFHAKKYRKVLGDGLFKEFTKAIGLSAHGVGAGSLVYLRRIFESLISDAHGVASSKEGWNEEVYKKARMNERIKLLKDQLPSYLVEHHKMYGVLSSGVHNQSESECLNFFPALKTGIELILDQKILDTERLNKTKELGQFLSQFEQRGEIQS